MVLVSGENKALIVQRVIGEKDNSLPASFLIEEKGKLLFLLDKDAGKLLSR